ncbi:MAG: hypothetical protein EAZ89_05505 [Bacteroidetes bacterium]|jgi:hypothetical protein|nr:MAG: hypothetical protein EAZ89_05505 [Bacteroidota bacterium]
MDWLNDIKQNFSKRRIKNLDKSKEYRRDFIDIESAKRIGLIVNTTEISDEDYQLVLTYAEALKKRKKEVVIVELNFQKKSEPRVTGFQTIIFVNPVNLNWLDYPTPEVENKLLEQELDILMDFDSSLRMTSKYLCSIARAKTRTGVHREGMESCYELMITRQQEEENNMKGIIREFDYFLNMIDNGNKVKA